MTGDLATLYKGNVEVHTLETRDFLTEIAKRI